ncbi:hypothetical protein HJFPF1_10048 [Paramyrothecium foliicola]|nr:hypothetical protein HJFPF1_10048 [Paramyrothecium foliicola]
MSGTALSDPAPGGHPEDRGVQQTSLDSNQHGASQNIIDETNDTSGTVVDANIGETIDAGKAGGGLSAHAREALNKDSTSSGATKGAATTQRGLKIGEETDLHDAAQSKQP